MTTQSVHPLVEDYLALWNETDATARAAAAERVLTADATYLDPLGSADGREEFSNLIGTVLNQFPGMRFTPGDLFDAHHDVARFVWHLGPPEEPQTITGFDVVRLDGGRIRSVVGFLDRVPG